MGLDLTLDLTKGVSSVRHPILKVRGAEASDREDQIAVEEPLEIRLGGMSLAVTMRTPGDDEELVAGLLFSEGAIASADDLDVVARYPGPEGERDTGNVINVLLRGDVTAARKLLRRNFIAASSCGVCGKSTIEAIGHSLPPVASALVAPVSLFGRIARAMNEAQPIFDKTGGLHAAGLFDAEGRLVVLREDIGRHNAVDKVIGHLVLARRMPLDRHILMVSGRASYEIMQKALKARIPVVAAVSAPSSMAVQMAQASDMTLVGFLREGGFNVYAGAHRVASDTATSSDHSSRRV
jgi:FdhD protein